jgi:hypothetical protein
MRLLKLATALFISASAAAAQGESSFECADLVSATVNNEPNRVALLRALLTDESELLRQYYGFEGTDDETNGTDTLSGNLKFDTVQTQDIEPGCVRIDGRLSFDDGPDVTRLLDDSLLPVSIFVVTEDTSQFMTKYQQARLAYVDDAGIGPIPQFEPSQVEPERKMPFDTFRVSAYVGGSRNTTMLGSQPLPGTSTAPLPGESIWFAADLGAGPQLVAVICERQCADYAGDGLVFPQFRPETAQAVVGTPRDTQQPTQTVPVLDDPYFHISIEGGDEFIRPWSVLTAGSSATELSRASDAVSLLSSEDEQNRAEGMKILFDLPGFPDDSGKITLENLTFESFTQQAEFRLHLSETVSRTVKRVEVVFPDPFYPSNPTMANCRITAQFYLGENLIGSATMGLNTNENNLISSLNFELGQDLVAFQDSAANDPDPSDGEIESTPLLVTTPDAESSCRIDWGNAAKNERSVELFQEEGAVNYRFDPDTGVARFTNIALLTTLAPAHIVVYNKTGPIDSNDLPTEESRRYPEWEDNELMEETLETLVDAAEAMLQTQASDVRISFGHESSLQQDFTQSVVASENLIARAIKPTQGGVGIEALATNLSETLEALEDRIHTIVVLGRTGLPTGSDYCERVPEALQSGTTPVILVDFAPDSAIDAMEYLTLETTFSEGVPDILEQINRKLPILKCPSVYGSQLDHWVIFVEDRSNRGWRRSLADFATYLFEDQG